MMYICVQLYLFIYLYIQSVHALGHGIAKRYIQEPTDSGSGSDSDRDRDRGSASFIAYSPEQYIEQAVLLAHDYKEGMHTSTMKCTEQYEDIDDVVKEWRDFLLSAITVNSDRI